MTARVVSTDRSHDYSLSILKAIAIICVVAGHSYKNSCIEQIVGLFHVPVFFFVSGYLFKDKYLDSFLKYLWHKIKHLWWPAAKWLLVVVALNNVFVNLGLLGPDARLYGLKDFILQGLKAIFGLSFEANIFAGVWFIRILFMAAILGFVLIKYCNKSMGFVIAVLIITSFMTLLLPEIVPGLEIIRRLYLPFLSLVYYLTGYYYHKKEYLLPSGFSAYYSLPLFFILLSLGYLYCSTNMLSLNYKSIIPYEFLSIVLVILLLNSIKTIRITPPLTLNIFGLCRKEHIYNINDACVVL